MTRQYIIEDEIGERQKEEQTKYRKWFIYTILYISHTDPMK